MNRAILTGNLARDPELRTTQSGISVCSFTLAVNRRFANQQGVREADFIPIVVWRQQAENCARYLKKGRKCAVSGTIQTRSYEAQDGTKRYVTEIAAEEVEFLGGSQSGTGASQPPPPEPTVYNPQQTQMGYVPPIDQGQYDDELPF